MARLLLIYISDGDKIGKGLNMQRNRVKALIVEDNQDLSQLISEALREEDYGTDIASDGKSALRMIKNQIYDVMILDHNLSDITGLTLLKRINPIRPALKTVMISAYADNSVIKMARKLGVYDFLEKPFYIEKLVKVVNKAIEKKEDKV